MRKKILKTIKKALFGEKEKDFKIIFGLAKNLKFFIDPKTNSQRILGLAESELSNYFKNIAPKAKTFIDIGASDGYYPIIVSFLNQNAEIIGCEPRSIMKMQFEKNLGINTIAKPKRIRWVDSFIGENYIRLDELLEYSKEPIFCKIDVDGSELSVLKSGKNVLSKKQFFILLETHSSQLEKDCEEFLKNLGFKTRIINKAWWRIFIPEERPISHNRWLFAEKL